MEECILCFQSEIKNKSSYGYNGYLTEIYNLLNYLSNHKEEQQKIRQIIKFIVEEKLTNIEKNEYNSIMESFICFDEEIKNIYK